MNNLGSTARNARVREGGGFLTARNAEVRKVVGFFYREERGGVQGGGFVYREERGGAQGGGILLPRGTRRCARWWVSFTARNAEVRKVGFNTDYAYA